VVRKIDTWTVLRLSILFWFSLVLVVLVAGVLLWAVASSVGVFPNITKFMASLGFEKFKLHGGVILKAAMLGGLVFTLVGTGANVLMAVLYNLISDVVGGVELIMLEEEPVRRTAAMTRQVAASGNGEAAASGRVTSARSGL
jgi:hypothetical protein